MFGSTRTSCRPQKSENPVASHTLVASTGARNMKQSTWVRVGWAGTPKASVNFNVLRCRSASDATRRASWRSPSWADQAPAKSPRAKVRRGAWAASRASGVSWSSNLSSMIIFQVKSHLTTIIWPSMRVSKYQQRAIDDGPVADFVKTN